MSWDSGGEGPGTKAGRGLRASDAKAERQMGAKWAPNAHQMQFGVPTFPLPGQVLIFNFDFHFPTCGFMIFVSMSSFISNLTDFIFNLILDSRGAPRGAPPFFLCLGQKPCVKAIYGPGPHTHAPVSYTYARIRAPQPFTKRMAGQSPCLLGQPSAKRMARAGRPRPCAHGVCLFFGQPNAGRMTEASGNHQA